MPMYLRLKWVGEDFMCCVKAVAMDMNTNYSSAFADKYPEIEIVYDGFHILKWFNDQVIDSLRRSETKRLKKEADVLSSIGEVAAAAAIESERKLLFGSRWNLLVNERTLRAKDAMNAGLNAQAKRIAKIDGRDPTEVGHRISSGILEGTNTLVKNIRRQAFGLVDFDYFGLLVWEQTHRPNSRRKTSKPRPYYRKEKRNVHRLKQTIYRLDLREKKASA